RVDQRGARDHRPRDRQDARHPPRTGTERRHARHVRRYVSCARRPRLCPLDLAGRRTAGRGRVAARPALGEFGYRSNGVNRFRSGVRRLGRGAPLALLFVAALGAGCASTGPIEPPADAPDPDKFLFDRGSEYLADEKWSTAREYFRRLVDGYPQSPYRAEAKLGIGDTYLGENSAEGQVYALNEFREFLSFYPTHPRADYAQYRLAMAHFQQMRAPQRDQTATKDAIRELTTFLERYPDSALRPEVET